MISKSTLLHLRIPFSFFLLPVFLFASSIAGDVILVNWWLALIAIHVFLYPASNGFNSYFDQDEGSIGGLRNPPAVSKNLYVFSILFDGLAIAIGLLISVSFSCMLFLYGLISKAYSHPITRLKKMPVMGLLTVGLFQGFFTFLMSYQAITMIDLQQFFQGGLWKPAALSTLLLLGSYPMTQVYQHEEDHARGDHTISLKLGINGTFIFTGLFFSVSVALFLFYFLEQFDSIVALMFISFLFPVLVYFLFWFFKVLRDRSKADYVHTMWLNLISACCLNGFFLWLWWYR
jgi:1,4-dihydroxy-2-naphthoate octaprenyltransferase